MTRPFTVVNHRYYDQHGREVPEERVLKALALFQYIADHEESEGVIAKRLLWANEAERVLKALLPRLQQRCACLPESGCYDALDRKSVQDVLLPPAPACLVEAIREAKGATP